MTERSFMLLCNSVSNQLHKFRKIMENLKE